jgi:hypothetical protein
LRFRRAAALEAAHGLHFAAVYDVLGRAAAGLTPVAFAGTWLRQQPSAGLVVTCLGDCDAD